MNLKNTKGNYGLIAKTIHWLTALLFLGSYLSIYYRHNLTESKTPENWNALQVHLSIGVTVAVMVLLRIIWRIYSEKPALEPGRKWEHLAANTGHYALYLAMIIMPLTGYLGTGANTEFWFLFDIPKFEDTALFSAIVSDGLGITFKEFEKPIDFIHKELMGENVLLILIFGHIGAALYHHFIKKDRTLVKMTTGTK